MGEPFLDSLFLGDLANTSRELFLERPVGGKAPALREPLADSPVAEVVPSEPFLAWRVADKPVVGRVPLEPFLACFVVGLAAVAVGLAPRLPTEALGLLASMIRGLFAPKLDFFAAPAF